MMIKFCSFNIRYGHAEDGDDRWDNRRDMLCDIWRAHAWDVVGIQEAFRNQIDYIRKRLPEYAEAGVGRDDGESAGEHCAILYRADRFELLETDTFWFSATPDVPGSRGPGTRHPRICTWVRLCDRAEGRAFFVYNVHTDHESQEARELASRMLIERGGNRSHPDPAVAMGDFNANPDNPAIIRLTSANSPFPIDTYRAAHPDDSEAYTFHGFSGANQDGKIDYIFATPGWHIDASEIVRDNVDGRYPSDHFPVTATLSV